MLTKGSSTSLSLIEQARELDPAAWNRLCDVYGPFVYRWARLVGMQDSDAADIGQEVFTVVANRIAAFDHSIPGATFRGWLKTIARNKIGDHLRTRSVRVDAIGGSSAFESIRELPEDLPETNSSDLSFDPERSLLFRTLQTIQSEFEPRTWKAFWGSTVESRHVGDLSEELGMTKKAIRQSKYRVLKRLRGELGPH